MNSALHLAPPLFRDVKQVGIVVRDMRTALAAYTERLGLGPWRVMTWQPPDLRDTYLHGNPASYSMQLAVARTGNMMWELIQPLDGPSIYKEFLDAHGEGIHHVMIDYGETPFEDALAAFEGRAFRRAMEGTFRGIRFVYFATEAATATTIELVHLPPGYTPVAPDYWYPASPVT